MGVLAGMMLPVAEESELPEESVEPAVEPAVKPVWVEGVLLLLVDQKGY